MSPKRRKDEDLTASSRGEDWAQRIVASKERGIAIAFAVADKERAVKMDKIGAVSLMVEKAAM